MIEFDTFCYLQNQKTGCTMVEAFLRQQCSEDIRRYEKHRVPKQRKPGTFYFISVREPLDTYLSLFNYGLDGKGELFGRLRIAGAGTLYAHGIDGFGDWLEFVLDASHAALVYPSNCLTVASQLGLVSTRFLRLAVLDFEQQCSTLTNRAAMIDYAESHRMVDAVIHYENLQQELTALIAGQLRHAFANLQAALAWIASPPRINASARRDQPDKPPLSDRQRALLIEREWYLYQTHYDPITRLPTP